MGKQSWRKKLFSNIVNVSEAAHWTAIFFQPEIPKAYTFLRWQQFCKCVGPCIGRESLGRPTYCSSALNGFVR